MIAKQEEKILIFISHFGRTYADVLGQTLYENEQSARSKISAMKKKGLVKLIPTKLTKPRNAIVLTSESKKFLENLGYTPKANRGAISHIQHNMLEQVAFFHLSKLGKVTRTSVYHHKNKYHAIPDLVLKTKTMSIAVEIETTQKSAKRYKDFTLRASQDNFDRVLFIGYDMKFLKIISSKMSIWDKLNFIDIDTMKKNISENGKINPISQKGLLPPQKPSPSQIEKDKEIKNILEKNNQYGKINELTFSLETALRINKQKELSLNEKEEEINAKRATIAELHEKNEKYKEFIKKQKKLLSRSCWDKFLAIFGIR